MQRIADTQDLKVLTADALRLLGELNRLATGVLCGPHTGLDKNEEFLLAHRLRMLRFSQGIEVTAASGLLDPTGALLRVLIELWYVIAAVANDPSNLTDLLNQGQAEGGKALKGLKDKLSPDQRDALLTDEYLEAGIASLSGGTGFIAHNWAGLADSMASYATLYRLVSRHSHGGSSGTLDYFEGLDTDSPRLRLNVRAELAPEYCVVAATLMIDSLRMLPLQTTSKECATALTHMETSLEALRRRNNTMNAGDAQ